MPLLQLPGVSQSIANSFLLYSCCNCLSCCCSNCQGLPFTEQLRGGNQIKSQGPPSMMLLELQLVDQLPGALFHAAVATAYVI